MSSGASDGPAAERREVVLDLGTADVVDLRPVTVQAAPGDVVVLRSGNPGRGADDESPVHHLFTSAPSEAPPPLFVPAGAGVVPNPGAWGLCRGGSAAAATTNCPVPPAEGPAAFDGQAYFSLGALLPGETRELPLSDDLAEGRYRFTCAIHPRHVVDVEVVPKPQDAPPSAPLDEADVVARAQEGQSPSAGSSAAGAVVRLAPQVDGPAAELLRAVPAEVLVPVGGSVQWRVEGRSPHTVELGVDHPPHLADTTAAETAPVVPADGRWDGTGEVRSGVLSTDPGVDRAVFELVFTRPGLYRAYDRFAPTVQTTVRVG